MTTQGDIPRETLIESLSNLSTKAIRHREAKRARAAVPFRIPGLDPKEAEDFRLKEAGEVPWTAEDVAKVALSVLEPIVARLARVEVNAEAWIAERQARRREENQARAGYSLNGHSKTKDLKAKDRQRKERRARR